MVAGPWGPVGGRVEVSVARPQGPVWGAGWGCRWLDPRALWGGRKWGSERPGWPLPTCPLLRAACRAEQQ